MIISPLLFDSIFLLSKTLALTWDQILYQARDFLDKKLSYWIYVGATSGSIRKHERNYNGLKVQLFYSYQ